MSKILALILAIFGMAPEAKAAATYFAELAPDNTVIRVIVVSPGDAKTEAEGIAFCQQLFGGRWVQTFQDGQRGKYAGKGESYDPVLDTFLSRKPAPSWSLDVATKSWKPPIAEPKDGKLHRWREDLGAWEVIELGKKLEVIP